MKSNRAVCVYRCIVVVPLYACPEGVQAVVDAPPVAAPGGKVSRIGQIGYPFNYLHLVQADANGSIILPKKCLNSKDPRRKTYVPLAMSTNLQ